MSLDDPVPPSIDKLPLLYVAFGSQSQSCWTLTLPGPFLGVCGACSGRLCGSGRRSREGFVEVTSGKLIQCMTAFSF